MRPNAEDLAAGRWPELLMAKGISQEFFGQRNGPCPFCGGKDRYRWSAKKELWVCNQCTDGKYANGFRMLMMHLGLNSFADAADIVREHYGENSGNNEPAVRRVWVPPSLGGMSDEERNRNLEKMTKIWEQSLELSEDDPVMAYLSRRVPGLNFYPNDIRFHPALDYWQPPETQNGRPELLGKFPAMVSLARNSDGEMVQIHKTYLTPDGHKANVPTVKKTERGVGCNSFAIRMMEVYDSDTIAVSEGIETGLAAAMLRQVPVWPCLNGPAMAEFSLPIELRGQVRNLVIFADNDEPKQRRDRQGKVTFTRPGSAYAAKLAARAKKAGVKVLILKPARTGSDMSDHWLDQCQDVEHCT